MRLYPALRRDRRGGPGGPAHRAAPHRDTTPARTLGRPHQFSVRARPNCQASLQRWGKPERIGGLRADCQSSRSGGTDEGVSAVARTLGTGLRVRHELRPASFITTPISSPCQANQPRELDGDGSIPRLANLYRAAPDVTLQALRRSFATHVAGRRHYPVPATGPDFFFGYPRGGIRRPYWEENDSLSRERSRRSVLIVRRVAEL